MLNLRRILGCFVAIQLWLAVSNAQAQYPTRRSLEVMALEAESISMGKISSVTLTEKQADQGVPCFTIGFEPTEVIKGKVHKDKSVVAWLTEATLERVRDLQRRKVDVLFIVHRRDGKAVVDWYGTWSEFFDSGLSSYYYNHFIKDGSIGDVVNDIKSFLEYNESDPAKGLSDFSFGGHTRFQFVNNKKLIGFCKRILSNDLSAAELEAFGFRKKFESWQQQASWESRMSSTAISATYWVTQSPDADTADLLLNFLENVPENWRLVQWREKDWEVTIYQLQLLQAKVVEALEELGVEVENKPPREKILWRRKIAPAEVAVLRELKHRHTHASHFHTSRYVEPEGEHFHVRSLWIRDLDSIPDLSMFSELKMLKLQSIKDPDLKPLANLVQLEELVLDGLSVSDLKPLSGLKNLKKLSLASTDVADLTPLAELENLEELNLFGTKVRDLQSLKNLGNLKSVNLPVELRQ